MFRTIWSLTLLFSTLPAFSQNKALVTKALCTVDLSHVRVSIEVIEHYVMSKRCDRFDILSYNEVLTDKGSVSFPNVINFNPNFDPIEMTFVGENRKEVRTERWLWSENGKVLFHDGLHDSGSSELRSQYKSSMETIELDGDEVVVTTYSMTRKLNEVGEQTISHDRVVERFPKVPAGAFKVENFLK